MRIVSLLPATTDIVVALGYGAELVGFTHHCEPPGGGGAIVTTTGGDAPDLHGPHRIDAAALVAAHPDVVLVRSTCEHCPVPGRPPRGDCPLPAGAAVHAYDPTDLAGVVDGVTRVGEAIGNVREGLALASHLRQRLRWLERSLAAIVAQPVAVIDPVGRPPGDGWVTDVVAAARCSVAASRGPPPPATVLALDTAESHPVMAGDAPGGTSIAAGGEVYAVAARSLSRPGPGLVDGAEALAWVFHRPHPDLRPAPGTAWRLTDRGWADVSEETGGQGASPASSRSIDRN